MKQYSLSLENPPLLIVSDISTIEIHTNWNNRKTETYRIGIEDLANAQKRDLLKWAFNNPEKLRPDVTREMLTEEAARSFAGLALTLRERGHNAEEVAHFVNRLVFCMFAEDVGLLPNKMFQRLLEACAGNPTNFQKHAPVLFEAMRQGGSVGFEKVEWFNGGLAIRVERKLIGRNVLDVLGGLFVTNGPPEHIWLDDGLEFIAIALRQWLQQLHVKTLYIEPGSPWENGCCESFNSKLRDELLAREIFYTLREAQILTESWRKYYKTPRPHSSLCYRPPAPQTISPVSSTLAYYGKAA